MGPWAGIVFGVLTTAIGKDQTADEHFGIFLEDYACQGRNMIYPVYYDTLLQSKLVRDTESKAMLDIIFAGRVYDIGAMYNWRDFAYTFVYLTMT